MVHIRSPLPLLFTSISNQSDRVVPFGGADWLDISGTETFSLVHENSLYYILYSTEQQWWRLYSTASSHFTGHCVESNTQILIFTLPPKSQAILTALATDFYWSYNNWLIIQHCKKKTKQWSYHIMEMRCLVLASCFWGSCTFYQCKLSICFGLMNKSSENVNGTLGDCNKFQLPFHVLNDESM